jgi:hypothetical protein
MELSYSWEATSHSATQEFPNTFTELENVLPCSQELSTSLYPEPH